MCSRHLSLPPPLPSSHLSSGHSLHGILMHPLTPQLGLLRDPSSVLCRLLPLPHLRYCHVQLLLQLLQVGNRGEGTQSSKAPEPHALGEVCMHTAASSASADRLRLPREKEELLTILGEPEASSRAVRRLRSAFPSSSARSAFCALSSSLEEPPPCPDAPSAAVK